MTGRLAGAQEEDGVLELFQTAALLLANREEAVALVERAVDEVQVDPCADPGQAREETRGMLLKLALARAVALDPAGFVQDGVAGTEVCFDTEDMESTGVTHEQLSAIVQGPDAAHLREWLEHLQPAARVVFVLRAMLGQDSAEVAEELRLAQANGGQGWTQAQVGVVFRGALCSLAGLAVHVGTARTAKSFA